MQTVEDSADTMGFGRVESYAQRRLEESVAELARLRESIANEKIPLHEKLTNLEDELSKVRLEYQQTTRLLDSRTLDLSNLRAQIKSRQEESTYLSNLLDQYIRSFESRVHIAELQRYSDTIEAAKLAPENSNLNEAQVYEAQAALVTMSLERLHEVLGGTRFQGTAVDTSGRVKRGTFALIGPAALFCSEDGAIVGTAEQRLGSLEPTVIGFESENMAKAAAETVTSGAGLFPLDPTLGNAHKIEATKETLLEHVRKGGPVMYPILGLMALTLVVVVLKWLELACTRKPSQKRVRALLRAVADHDQTVAFKARAVGGPTGKMLLSGVEHIKEPPELIEEVMYERLLTTKLRLQRFLPFVAISAAAAPLLGLLGTVTGIINTFKLITVFGSGDVKTLSGGISEALITTEFGLIVAIPSLLIHAFLSRKARGMVSQMEKAAVALLNQIARTPYRRDETAELLADMPRAVAQEVLRNLHRQDRPRIRELVQYSQDSAGGIMDTAVISINRTGTVGDAIASIRAATIDDEDLSSVSVVDEQGKYVGEVPVRLLLTRPEHTSIESLVDTKVRFVRVNARPQDVQDIFGDLELMTLPVLDHNDRLVGRITRNGKVKGDKR